MSFDITINLSKKFIITQSELSKFLDMLILYYQGFKAKDIDEYQYKIHDNSVRLRHFLDVNNENDIEAIFTDCEDHFLYKFTDGNESLCFIIDFNLSVKMLNAISSKFSDKQKYFQNIIKKG